MTYTKAKHSSLRHEYLRLRGRAYPAKLALTVARANILFSSLEDSGFVRVRVEWDEDFSFTNEKREEDVRQQIDLDGVWGYIVEARSPLGGPWQHVSSLWGLVGCEAEWMDEVTDVRLEAIAFVNSFAA